MKPPSDSKEDENATQNMGELKIFDFVFPLIFKDDPIEGWPTTMARQSTCSYMQGYSYKILLFF